MGVYERISMIAVIIAGGSGTRLWPLSTHDYPKQLLRINGDKNSLLQNTYRRAKQLADDVYVMPETRLTKHVVEQLPELKPERLIVEPALRGTANCVIAVLSQLSRDHDPDEPIAFLWADHYIRDIAGFLHSFRVAAKTAAATRRLVLVGVEPDYPATGFGYIEKGDRIQGGKFIFHVASFKEKPSYETAQEYFRSGNYLWNTGYLVGSISAFKDTMQRHAPEMYKRYEQLCATTSAQAYQELYAGFETDVLEYALTERTPELLVVPATFDWIDLGSFADIHKIVERDKRRNHVQGRVEVEEVENSYIQNQDDKPVVVIGLDNIVVVNSPDGILVARKDLSQKVGAISKRFTQPK
jgi:mannose-1-phosphate guanylyltransferase